MVNKARNKRQTDTVLHIRVDRDTADLFDYLANSENLSRKDLLKKMTELYEAVKKNRFQSSDLVIQRLNQLINEITMEKREVNMLRKSVNNGFSTILNLDNGDE